MREHALRLYQRLTARMRRRAHASLRDQGRLPIGILFYHRVADRDLNPWTISRDDFRRHLDWIQGRYDVVDLAEAQRRIRRGFNDRPTVSITFDDGYGENAEFAIPELLRRRLSATYFVATDFVEERIAFPHDAGRGRPARPNTVEELCEFAARDIAIGAHTRGHVDLGAMTDREEIDDQILGSIQRLEAWTGQPVRYFAFPFGLPRNTSAVAVDTIIQSGLAGFCTAYGAWNWPDSRGFHLRRIHADPGLERLKNWLTLDPRKLVDRRRLPFVEPDAVPASGTLVTEAPLVGAAP